MLIIKCHSFFKWVKLQPTATTTPADIWPYQPDIMVRPVPQPQSAAADMTPPDGH